MGIFQPTAMRERVTDITPELLTAMGVKALLLDVDNTLPPTPLTNPLRERWNGCGAWRSPAFG